jgi:hypothetical protein
VAKQLEVYFSLNHLKILSKNLVPGSILLHNINNTHWAVAIEEKEPEPEPEEENGEAAKQLEVYFSINP